MSEIDIPQESKSKISTRIDTVAHDILKKMSIEKYGSKSNMSAILTEAVQFIHDPTPTQQVAKQKYLSNEDVYPRDPDCSGSKVIHWTAPTDLVQEMRSLATSNREFIESAIYWYESAYVTMNDGFSTESVSADQVVDWDVLEHNYSVTHELSDISGADVPLKPSKRRPFIYSIFNSDDGLANFSVFSQHYDMIENGDDVSGLPKEETRRKDWQALIDDKHLIPTPSKKAVRPIDEVESDWGTYFPRKTLDDENPLEPIIEDYLQDMESWINTKAQKGSTFKITNAVFQSRENTLSVIANYEIQELQEYADRAEELHNRLIEDVAHSVIGGDK